MHKIKYRGVTVWVKIVQIILRIFMSLKLFEFEILPQRTLYFTPNESTYINNSICVTHIWVITRENAFIFQ